MGSLPGTEKRGARKAKGGEGVILPSDSIGISDIMAWRECPRRMDFGMRRHTDAGEHPEAVTVSTAYGSAFHDIVEFVEREDAFDDEAVQHGFDHWARWLEPDDLERLRADLATYRARDYLGVRTIAVEGEFRVPLVTLPDGKIIFFRFKVDRLYQSLTDEGLFISIDYKTSRWRRTEEEVHSDVQQWAYNWGLHEVFPEIRHLSQFYDQLRYGAVPTSKTDAQRAQIKEWLTRHVLAILKDDERGADGLLQPKLNDWCAYCPIAESCTVVADATDFALAKIAALAPERKEGRKTIVELDPARMDEYVAKLDDVQRAKKLLERYESSVRDVLLRMPQQRRESYGYDVREKKLDRFGPEALRRMHERLGDRFYEAAGVSKTAIERVLEDEDREFVLGLAEKTSGSPYVQRRTRNAA